MGFVIVVAMTVTFMVASRYSGDPFVAVGSVAAVTTIFFTIGHVVINSFERLAGASRAQAEFISVISHQLRTPLSAMKWQISTMKEKMGKEHTSIISILNEVENENERVIKLVSSLLEVNRIEEGRSFIRKENVSLWGMTEKMLREYKISAESMHIDVTAERTPADPFTISVDELKLRWMLENLIDNAIRYSHKGGKVHIRLSKKDGKVRWEIQDEGVGIPEVDQKKIFQKFFRSDNAFTMKTEGSGLGLFIVKSFAEVMGGKVGFVSKEGKGTTFYLVFPAAESQKSR
ncbi:MAG: hypothetical protein A3F85_04445 [Candidatus Ryanbacteria bacterium RIFCSPLOWO2_12_FULL_44_26]|nr:MAG: hypothetical protein A3F85_04445 [Candidatus Ryanbacteria bacterium RIFCSPLOWO2_12_FULL_44_26]